MRVNLNDLPKEIRERNPSLCGEQPKSAPVPREDPEYFPEYMCGAAGMRTPILEYRFNPKRMWRFDAAWIDEKVACEVEGGIWKNGGHNRGKIYSDNMDKYNSAQILGWIVLRYEPNKINYKEISEVIMKRKK